MSSPSISSQSVDLLRDPAELKQHLQSQRATDGAREFEASLFASVLEKMEKSLSITGESDDDAAHDTVTAIGVRAVAQSLAQSNVLGFAPMIEKSLGIGAASTIPTTGNSPNSATTGEK
ncbi:MAG: hypothetical protein P4M01_12845 [Acidobacteriota bacterium]|nr:hypothetical protein [Acidobacteriota bacterium]